MDSGAGPRPDPIPNPDPLHLTPDLLADLQAGLLDDATAARVRRHARADPEAQRVLTALDTVRRELAHLGSDAESAPDVPAAVTTKVGATLRRASPVGPAPAHLPPRTRFAGAKRAGLVIGIGAVAAAAVLGVLMLSPAPGPPVQIPEEGAATAGFPLSDSQLRALISEPQELGPLADAQRRASCLTGLGYSPTLAVLGGRPLEVSGRSGVLLLVSGDTPEQIRAVAVEPTCSAAHTGLLAETVFNR